MRVLRLASSVLIGALLAGCGLSITSQYLPTLSKQEFLALRLAMDAHEATIHKNLARLGRGSDRADRPARKFDWDNYDVKVESAGSNVVVSFGFHHPDGNVVLDSITSYSVNPSTRSVGEVTLQN